MNTSALDMHGLAVEDIDGTKVGDVVDFYFDARTEDPQWLAVEAGTVGHKIVLVPVEDITRTDGGLRTPYQKDMIMDAPHAEGASLNRKMEEALYSFYHLRRELPERTTERAAFEQDRSKSADARLRSWKAWKAA